MILINKNSLLRIAEYGIGITNDEAIFDDKMPHEARNYLIDYLLRDFSQAAIVVNLRKSMIYDTNR